MVDIVVREEGLDVPTLMHHIILLLLYVDDVAIFSYYVDGMQCLLGALEAFCQSSGLIVNDGSVNYPTSPILYVYI